jgi:2-hydroxy-3-keto-5-methylthiopentenyl-1-phosphate phosphatase
MLFVIDFDGTLSVRDTVDTLLGHYADPAWQEVEQAWLDGSISAVECMRTQIRMVRSDHVTLANFFRGIQLDASFLPFYRHVREFARVVVVSDGLDHAIQVALRNVGLTELPVHANRLHFVPGGIDISFPHIDPSCDSGNGVCKCAVARDLAAEVGGPFILVGDGKSDACLAGRADLVFAKSGLAGHCERAGIPFRRFQTFADVLAVVRGWHEAGVTIPATHRA